MSAITQSLCTESIEPYMNLTDGTKGPSSLSGSLCWRFVGVIGSTRTFTATQSVQLDRCVDLSVLAVWPDHPV